MRTIPISKFRATCLAVLEQVRATGEPVLVTRHGRPVVRIVPHSRAAWFGAMRGTAVMHDDLIAPAADPSEWKALAGEVLPNP